MNDKKPTLNKINSTLIKRLLTHAIAAVAFALNSFFLAPTPWIAGLLLGAALVVLVDGLLLGLQSTALGLYLSVVPKNRLNRIEQMLKALLDEIKQSLMDLQ